MSETNLTKFYDDLKQKLNNDETSVTPPKMKVVMNPGGLNNSPNSLIWRNKAAHCCNQLKDDCHKHILLDIYCKILPLDQEFIDGNKGLMQQDIDSMLANKGMSATQYMKSCYESTNAPLLEFIIRSVNNIGKVYMEESEEILKDAQKNGTEISEPETPSTDDEQIETQLVDIKQDGEYETFIDALKQKTINKIVSDVSKIINDKKEENDMTFDTTPVADTEEKLESTTSVAMNYIYQKLMKEGTEITTLIQNDIIGLAIRESTINQLDVVFKQPAGEFREFANRIRYGKGVLINESALINFR